MGADTAGRQELVLANTKLVDGRQQDQQRSPWPYLYIFDLNGDVHVHPTKPYSNGHTYSCIASPLNWNLQHCLFSSCLVRFHPANRKGMTSQVNKLYIDSLHNRHLQNGSNTRLCQPTSLIALGYVSTYCHHPNECPHCPRTTEQETVVSYTCKMMHARDPRIHASGARQHCHRLQQCMLTVLVAEMWAYPFQCCIYLRLGLLYSHLGNSLIVHRPQCFDGSI